MPGTSTWKMLTFSLLELTSSTAYRKKRFLTRNPMVYDTLNFSIKQSVPKTPNFSVFARQDRKYMPQVF